MKLFREFFKTGMIYGNSDWQAHCMEDFYKLVWAESPQSAVQFARDFVGDQVCYGHWLTMPRRPIEFSEEADGDGSREIVNLIHHTMPFLGSIQLEGLMFTLIAGSKVPFDITVRASESGKVRVARWDIRPNKLGIDCLSNAKEMHFRPCGIAGAIVEMF